MNDNRRRWAFTAVSLLLLLTIGLLSIVSCGALRESLLGVGEPTATPEPIVPTRTPTPAAGSYPAPSQTEAATATPQPPTQTATLSPTATRTVVPETEAENREMAGPAAGIAATVTEVPAAENSAVIRIPSELNRFGVSIAGNMRDAEAAHALGLPAGSAQNWNVSIRPPAVPAEYWQMVRVDQEGIRRTNWDEIADAIAANPGSKWLVGNEPDVIWQDNVTPERYAEIYHDVYTFIKERDPGALVAIGGVSQPTPLRRAYLDIVLDSYQERFGEPMPVDIWNVHAFTLREEAGSWGVDIPPGLEGEQGILYEIEDHDDIAIIAQNLRDFRHWMAERGYGDKPLVVSEYGILMPEDFGFPPERVVEFMTGTFDLFREMTGEEGYAADGDRLVQWWFWYSVYDGDLYSTGNLWDAETNQLTELGQAWTRYINDNAITGN